MTFFKNFLNVVERSNKYYSCMTESFVFESCLGELASFPSYTRNRSSSGLTKLYSTLRPLSGELLPSIPKVKSGASNTSKQMGCTLRQEEP